MAKFNIKKASSNFLSSIVSDVKGAVDGAIRNTVNQKLGSLGPLGKLAATFINQTGGFGASNAGRTISRAIISSNNTSSDVGDWRVSISVPEVIRDDGDILAPLRLNSGSTAFETGNRMILTTGI
jgi:hypothetical protein